MLVVVLFVSPRWEPSQTCIHGDGKLPTDVGAATEVQSRAGEKRDIQCSCEVPLCDIPTPAHQGEEWFATRETFQICHNPGVAVSLSNQKRKLNGTKKTLSIYQEGKEKRHKKSTGDREQIWGGKVHNIGTHYKSGWLRKEN